MTRTAARALAVAAVVAVAALTAWGLLVVLGGDTSGLTLQPLPEAADDGGSIASSRDAATSALPVAPQPRDATPVGSREFDADAAMRTIRELEAFGVRGGGSDAEARAAAYLRDRLAGLGLAVRVEEFPLPGGATSSNVIARVPGSSDTVIVLGAHYDTKPPSPGANDNASGCAALLEIARLVAQEPVVPTVEIVFFGAEEVIGSDPDDHHFGSRYRAANMTDAEWAAVAGMISIDMIGYGPDFHSRTMGEGPQELSDMVLEHARSTGVPMTYRADPGASGWSDHEAFEIGGVPVSWIEWRDDPVYHTAQDTAGHVSSEKVATAGRLVLGLVRDLDQADLARLLASRTETRP